MVEGWEWGAYFEKSLECGWPYLRRNSMEMHRDYVRAWNEWSFESLD